MGNPSQTWIDLSRLILAASVIWSLGPGTAVAAEIGVVGATSSGSAHTLGLVIEEPNFDWPITIRRNDSGDPAAVSVDVTPLIGPSARSVEQQRLLSNGQPVGQAALELPSLGQTVVRLTGTLPIKGDFKGQLGIIVGGQRIPYDITITRRDPTDPPKAVLVGVGSDNKLAMTSDRAEFEWPMIIRRDDTLTVDIDVKVYTSLLFGPSGRVIEPKLTKEGRPAPEALTLAPLSQALLTLSGKADMEGIYTGEITLETAGVRTPVALTLTRTRPDFDLKIDPISRMRDTAGDKGVGLRIRLQNSTGVDRDISLPMVARLDRVDASGSEPVDVGVAHYSVSYALPDGNNLRPPLRVAGDGGLDLLVIISGLDSPGNYKGTMRFTAADQKPVDASFELALRLSWICAALAIGAGVIIAALLRYFQQTARPRLMLQRDAIGLRVRLATLVQAEGADLVPRERQVIAFLIDQLDEASDNLAEANASTDVPQAAINLVRRKLPLLPRWIMSRRRHDAVQPPSVAVAIEPDLDLVFTTLMNAQATDEQIAAANTALQGIEEKIRQAMKAYIATAVSEIRAAISQFPEADRLRFDPVGSNLGTVENEANALHFDLAKAALDRARSGFAEIGALLLRERLDPVTAAIGFTAPEWTAFVTEIRNLLDAVAAEPDPERRVERWSEANRRYLVEVVRHAKSRVDFLLPSGVARDQLTTASMKLAAALTALASGNVAAARTAYDDAIAAAEQARPALLAAGSRLGATVGADAVAPQAGADVPVSIRDAAVGSVLPLPLAACRT